MLKRVYHSDLINNFIVLCLTQIYYIEVFIIHGWTKHVDEVGLEDIPGVDWALGYLSDGKWVFFLLWEV